MSGLAPWLGALVLVSAGATLLIHHLPAPASLRRMQRHAPYLPPTLCRPPEAEPWYQLAGGQLILSWAGGVLHRAEALLAANQALEHHLRRIDHPTDVGTFRLRQLIIAVTGLLVAAATLVWIAPPGPLDVVALCAPILVAGTLEHRVRRRSRRWQDDVRRELPGLCDHLGLLVDAGWSLGSALERCAARRATPLGHDLRRTIRRTRHGASLEAALGAWAERIELAEVQRFVRVVNVHHEVGDVSALLAEEARSTRAELHRELVADLQRRSQQVWIPVTVAALLPGTTFIAIPFREAIRTFAGG